MFNEYLKTCFKIIEIKLYFILIPNLNYLKYLFPKYAKATALISLGGKPWPQKL